MILNGKCHCGNISFVLRWEPEPVEIPARACTCSFCTKHGGVWTSCPTGSLKVSVARPSQVSKYAFGTKTATFHICCECGVVPVVTSEVDDPEGGPMSATPVVFDPTRVVDGIELSDDPILRYRPGAYTESVSRRTAT